MWKFSSFPGTLFLREINCGWFQIVKNHCFDNFEGFVFWFLKNLKMSKVPKNSKFWAAQMVIKAVFGASKWPKLISRKTWVSDKSWNFLIVQLHSQLDWPIVHFKSNFHFSGTHTVSKIFLTSDFLENLIQPRLELDWNCQFL